MTDLERFNLLWLCHAMTVPVSAGELYYYDGFRKKFFLSKSSFSDPDKIQLFDMIEMPVIAAEAVSLLKRLENIDSDSSGIVEIPRLNVQDKIAVQLLFLSKFPGVIHEAELHLAAERQEDVTGFIMDELLGHMESLSPMEPYWEDFKLKTIQYYLEKFTGLAGIALKML